LPVCTDSETIAASICDGGVMNSLLVITGGMGAGKTSVLSEASDLLVAHNIAHAAIDLDALGLSFLPSAAAPDCIMFSNLRSVCENYAALGMTRFLVARAIEDHAQLEICRGAVSATNMTVCRLVVSIETMQLRIRMRESGIAQRELFARVAKLNAILDHAQVEDFIVTNEDRLLTDVAREMLVKSEWISS
jgi:hypothetical protein